MTERFDDREGLDGLPEPTVRRPSRFNPSLIWLVPAIAVIAGLFLVVRSYRSVGPTITISFKTAEGLEEGKTELKYKNVVVGLARKIALDQDREHVLVRVQLSKEAADLAMEDTRFWVVRPRVDLSGISGLTTLVSGAYIGMDVGESTEPQRFFEGMELPPPVTHEQQGRRLVLSTDDLGSLSIGSPVYFRHLQVGRVVGFDLDQEGRSVKLLLFIDSPYDRYVGSNTRFWNVSGVSFSVGANGVQVNAQSLLSLIAGGIAFDMLPGETVQPATDNRFTLYADQVAAFAPPQGQPVLVRMRFLQSIRGLTVGAPVDFRGLELGKVKLVALDYDKDQQNFSANVTAEIFPHRLGQIYRKLRELKGTGTAPAESSLERMLEHGLYAQLRSGSLISGQLYVALDFPPKPVHVTPDLLSRPLEIPTIAGSLEQIQTQIADIVQKLDDVPFSEISEQLRSTLKSADKLLARLDTELAPEAKKTLEEVRATLGTVSSSISSGDGSFQQDAHQTLEEVNRAARSLRSLAEYLQRHPEALLHGKPDAAEPEVPSK